MTADKNALRRASREMLRSVTAGSRAGASNLAASLLLKQEEWRKANSVLLYIPLGDELDLLACLDHARSDRKTLALPRFDAERGVYTSAIWHHETALVRGPFGIAEPDPTAPELPLNRLDLMLVPGLAFDLAGRRLGRGKGFYDRLLVEASGVKCGVALDEQILPELPAEAHDIAMNCILTPTRWVKVASPVC